MTATVSDSFKANIRSRRTYTHQLLTSQVEDSAFAYHSPSCPESDHGTSCSGRFTQGTEQNGREKPFHYIWHSGFWRR